MKPAGGGGLHIGSVWNRKFGLATGISPRSSRRVKRQFPLRGGVRLQRRFRTGLSHQGPLTWATLRVLRVLLWRFHNADGGGRCFPSYERIAAAAKCACSSVAVAVKAIEDAELLTWVNRLTKIRRREQDLFGAWGSVWQVIRTSNGYRFLDPLEREPGRRVWCKSENLTGPQNQKKQEDGARLDGARVMQEASPRSPPPVPLDKPVIALQREHDSVDGATLSYIELAAHS
jgi:hypothetical protein